MERTSVRNWIERFQNNGFASEDRQTQIRAGWYDWFCKDSSLASKTNKMGNIIKQIKDNGKVDLDNWYVWFKNNCPMSGPLYDDFRIACLEDGEVEFTIQIDCCWNKHKYSVYGRRTKGGEFEQEPLFECDNSRYLVKWLNSAW